jgi:hypothetical protein
LLAVAIALFGAFMALLWSSGLEADYINVGRLLGRDSPEPRISTGAVGIFALLLSGVLIVVLAATRPAKH